MPAFKTVPMGTANFKQVQEQIWRFLEKPMARKIVIFDLDWTLIDPTLGTGRSLQQILLKNGYDVPFKRILEVSWAAEIGNVLLKLAPDLASQPDKLFAMQDSLGDYFIRNAGYNIRTQLVDDLAQIKERNSLVGVATNRDVSAKPAIDALGFGKYIDVLATTAEANRKPYPDMLELILENVGLKPKDAILVGDTEEDMGAAQAANVPFVRVIWERPKLD